MTTTNATKSFEARDLHLKAVTVFTHRAQVTREFSVELEEGITDVVVNNMAAALDSDSIQVSAPGVTIQKVEFKTSKAKVAREDGPKVVKLLEELKPLQSKLASKKDQKQIYDTHIESLKNIVTSVPLHTDSVVMGRNFGTLAELFSYHAEEASAVLELLRGVNAEIAELAPLVDDLQVQIVDKHCSEGKPKSIVVTLECDAKKKVDMKLIYQVDDACWSPSYDVRVTSDPASPATKHATIHYSAIIEQESGEDWNDAEVELSTAESRRAASAPKLETLNAKLRLRQKRDEQYEKINAPRCSVVTRRYMRSSTMNDAAEYCSEEASRSSERPTKFKEMRAEKHALTSGFKLPQKTTIPSDSSEHKVTISSLKFDLLVGLECFPSVKTCVFETASALNDSSYPLLRGQAAVYMDGEFTSKTTIQPAAVGEKFFVTLGVDSDVKSDDEKTSTTYEKKVHIKNLKTKEKVRVTMHLQVPKSTDSKIKIELLSPAKDALIAAEDANATKPPALGPRLREDNILDWTVELDEGQARELAVKWSVQAPADEIVEYVTQARALDRSDD